MAETATCTEVTTPPSDARPISHWPWLARGVLLLVLTWFAWHAGQVLVGANFHTVIPGKVYRGAQPTTAELEVLARDYGIRTIVNLRGSGAPHAWYVDMCRAAQRLGINLEDICFSAMRLPSTEELRRLLEVLERAEYPIYLHCRRGADRTGVIAAVVLLLQTDATLESALGQLSWRFGHVPIGKTAVLDRFLKLYADWLRENGAMHAPARLRHWLLEEYRGGWCAYEWEDFTSWGRHSCLPEEGTGKQECLPHVRVGEPISFRVRVRNTGTKAWQFRSGRFAGVHFGVFVHDENRKLISESRSAMLDKKVTPGESFEALVVVPPITTPGRYRVLVDLVEENHCWFYQVGAEPKEEEIVVRE
ncbi:MAG: tyrosine-protein phosphatase [Gemmataceae bacterium]|nr:tyrosine-protein phosphatase [Gemmataceae bacterium]MCI0742301.1 tyrosine-protein phosphatase [Gemmataceae bacterium]